MKTYNSHYINGAWQQATAHALFEVHDASTEEVMATVPQGTAEEATQAVLAARAAFPAWSALGVEERCVRSQLRKLFPNAVITVNAKCTHFFLKFLTKYL